MFDPYYTWLGIPPDEQPADPSRLLGLRRFESNPAVISNASDRQLAHVRTFQSGPHALESQRLLNEIASATHTLLNPSYKAAYDQQLAAAWNYSMHPAEPPPAYSYQPVLPVAAPYVPAPPRAMDTPAYVDSFAYGTPSPTAVATGFQPAPEAFFAPSDSSYARRKRPAESSFAALAKIIVGGAVGLAIGWVIINRLILPLQAQRDPDQALNPERKKHPPRRPPSAPKPPDGPRRNNPPIPPPPVPRPGDNSLRPDDNDNSGPKPPETAPAPPEGNGEPKPAPMPPPAADTNPFARLPDTIALPETEAGAAMKVLALACVPTDELTVALDSELADLDGARFNVTPSADSDTAWTITTEVEGSEVSIGSDVASLELRGTMLELKWADTKSESTKQLANCVLHLTCGPYSHHVQLRRCVTKPSVKIDLTSARQTMGVGLSPWPTQRSLVLTIDELVHFPTGAKLRGDKSRIQLDQEAAVEFDQMPGAAIEIKFGRQANGEIAAIVSPVFKEKKGGEFELTFQRLEEATTAAEKGLENASSAIRQVSSQLSSLENDYNSLLGTTPSTTAEQLDRSTRLDRLKSRIQTMRSRLRNLQREVPELQARIASAPVMREFLETLHNVAELKLRILAASPTHELTLVEFAK